MKYYFKVCLITLFSLAVTSCSKNDDSNSEAQTENPLEFYLTQADYGEDLEFIDAGHFELGFVVFTSSGWLHDWHYCKAS